MSLTGVVVRRSASELVVTGRLRAGAIAILLGLLLVVSGALTPAAGYFRVIAPVGAALFILYGVAMSRTRVVLQPSRFVLAGYDGLRPYRATGKLADLEIIGVSALMPQLEGIPHKDPNYFLQLSVAGRNFRAFRGLERSELEYIAAQLVEWKTRCAA